MSVEEIARRALLTIKLKWRLPDRGFLAGGSLANIMWEIKSGNKAKVNDIDVFTVSPISTTPNGEKQFRISTHETNYFESYGQLSSCVISKNSFIIKNSFNEGIFNFVEYEANDTSPMLIIESFDINCTRVGYSIEENKFYWTKDFEEFLNTGSLKVSNLNTPAHTAIRIVKKKYELNATLDEFEIELLGHIIRNHQRFCDLHRFRFKDRYKEMFLLNQEVLAKYFTLKLDERITDYVNNRHCHCGGIYYLESINENQPSINFNIGSISSTEGHLISLKDFLFFVRNIKDNPERRKIYDHLYFLFNRPDYINYDEDPRDIQFLSSFVKLYPKVIERIKGITFKKQIYLLKDILKNVGNLYDHQTAISVLQNVTFSEESSFDEEDYLLLGLSVRKKL